jgi:hypothetical protein
LTPEAEKGVDEHLHDSHQKEEEFLLEFYMTAQAAAALLEGAWRPNQNCNNSVREVRKALLETGMLTHLVFDGASVYHNEDGLASVRIALKSSKRVVTIRVTHANGELVAEKILDKTTADNWMAPLVQRILQRYALAAISLHDNKRPVFSRRRRAVVL